MVARNTMNISLTRELERFVNSRVGTGRYQSASEVVREALRLMERDEREHKAAISSVRKKISIGVEQIKRGQVVDGEEAFARIRRRARASRTTSR